MGSVAALSEKDRGSKIIQWIRFTDKRLRRKHPFLTRFQNQIGFASPSMPSSPHFCMRWNTI
jgi:hypothetical protein